MSEQIDLTYTEPENYGDLLFGVVATRYEDGEIFIRNYDVRDVTGEPHSQVSNVTVLDDARARQLRDWLNEVLEEPEPAPELFPGTTDALDALTIRKAD